MIIGITYDTSDLVRDWYVFELSTDAVELITYRQLERETVDHSYRIRKSTSPSDRKINAEPVSLATVHVPVEVLQDVRYRAIDAARNAPLTFAKFSL